jgi:sugar/nucleoside kinase (ribokinase family)
MGEAAYKLGIEDVVVVAPVRRDGAGFQIMQLFHSSNMRTDGLIRDGPGPTPTASLSLDFKGELISGVVSMDTVRTSLTDNHVSGFFSPWFMDADID